MLSRKALLAILLGLLLVSAPLIKADEEEYDDDDAEEADDKGGEEKDVVVITKDNFADKIKGSKFALVSTFAWGALLLRVPGAIGPRCARRRAPPLAAAAARGVPLAAPLEARLIPPPCAPAPRSSSSTRPGAATARCAPAPA